MEVAVPVSGSAIDCYEDMFKEITRKLYGEEGLPELTTNERLPTTQDRGLTPIDYDVEPPLLKPEEHITAFGLAALMQNGFPATGILNPPPFQQHKQNVTTYEDKWIVNEETLHWTQSKIASYNPAQKLYRCAECNCIGYLPRVAEHWLGTHSNLRAFQCPQCPYESAWLRCLRQHFSRQHNIQSEEMSETFLKNNVVLQEITRYLQRLKSKLENNCKIITNNGTQNQDEYQTNTNVTNNRSMTTQSVSTISEQSSSNKRYSCTFCPYATDRRDLFTRHENIHREEKPFQCYVCQKQFNRADHVKKHFLRMHREHPYDLNRIRRHPPKNASGMSYYQKYNSTEMSSQNTETVTNAMGTLNNSLSIPNNFNNLSRNNNNNNGNTVRSVNANDIKTTIKSSLSSKCSGGKRKGEKRFSCCYCSWSGVDNWCLKRHMNTHLKPFVCGLCDYKAARSERLATHVLKVHNKRACGKCNFLADDLTQLTAHQQEQHPLEQRNRNNNGNSILRNTTFNSVTSSSSSSAAAAVSFSTNHPVVKTHELSAAAVFLQHGNRLLQGEPKPWKQHQPKQHGAARLFSYLEASDGSEPESDSRGAEDMNRMNLNHRIQSDFPEAGDVGSPVDDDEGEEIELPLFVCQTCGCEFEDDASLETHQYTHRYSSTSPAKAEDSKENINPEQYYVCQVCEATFTNQISIMSHMITHTSMISVNNNLNLVQEKEGQTKRSRKQSQPKKIILPFWDNEEIEVLCHMNGKFSKWKNGTNNIIMKLFDKHMTQLVMRKRMVCRYCRDSCLSQYHTRGSLALHHYWRHLRARHFQCEHCDARFRHRYQIILHASKVHVQQKYRDKQIQDKIQTVPTKEPIFSNVPASEESSPSFLTTSLTTPVPDITTNSSNSVHKLGMTFFDHSFLHSNAGLNGHMPIIIPTFPPN